MMDWLWHGGGVALFDVYSFHHFAWFVTITLVLYPIFHKHTWAGAAAIAISWEILEHWIAYNVLDFPFAGKELLINKMVGDPISNILGFLTATYIIKVIRKQKHV